MAWLYLHPQLLTSSGDISVAGSVYKVEGVHRGVHRVQGIEG